MQKTQEKWVWSLDWEDPWWKVWQLTPVSCLENLMDRRAWWAKVHRFIKSPTGLNVLSMHTLFTFVGYRRNKKSSDIWETYFQYNLGWIQTKKPLKNYFRVIPRFGVSVLHNSRDSILIAVYVNVAAKLFKPVQLYMAAPSIALWA